MRSLRIVAAIATAAALSGCVSLFPKDDPAQLYRFGAGAPAAAPATAGAGRVDVVVSPIAFTQASAGDRILTVTGSEAAYIAQSRWIAPASVMFGEAMDRRFAQAQVVRLTNRRQATASSLSLSVGVDTFEARYADPKAAPTVAIGLTAKLIQFPARTVVAERRIDAQVRASDNRVSAIVAAYDQATGQALDQLVGWTDENAK